MADTSGDEFTSSLKCVSQRFNIEGFRETQQEAIFNLVKRKRCFSFTTYGLREILIFSVFSVHRR